MSSVLLIWSMTMMRYFTSITFYEGCTTERIPLSYRDTLVMFSRVQQINIVVVLLVLAFNTGLFLCSELSWHSVHRIPWGYTSTYSTPPQICHLPFNHLSICPLRAMWSHPPWKGGLSLITPRNSPLSKKKNMAYSTQDLLTLQRWSLSKEEGSYNLRLRAFH